MIGASAPRAGYDFIVQGVSAMMDLTGDPDGLAQKIGAAFADIITCLYAVIGIEAALAEREHSGRGNKWIWRSAMSWLALWPMKR